MRGIARQGLPLRGDKDKIDSKFMEQIKDVGKIVDFKYPRSEGW